MVAADEADDGRRTSMMRCVLTRLPSSHRRRYCTWSRARTGRVVRSKAGRVPATVRWSWFSNVLGSQNLRDLNTAVGVNGRPCTAQSQIRISNFKHTITAARLLRVQHPRFQRSLRFSWPLHSPLYNAKWLSCAGASTHPPPTMNGRSNSHIRHKHTSLFTHYCLDDPSATNQLKWPVGQPLLLKTWEIVLATFRREL